RAQPVDRITRGQGALDDVAAGLDPRDRVAIELDCLIPPRDPDDLVPGQVSAGQRHRHRASPRAQDGSPWAKADGITGFSTDDRPGQSSCESTIAEYGPSPTETRWAM